MEKNLKLTREDGVLISNPTLYHRLVGSLIYLTITRPDISFAVQVVSQFVSQPRRHHLSTVHRILRYFKGTCDCGLFFPSNNSPTLIAYADADYAGCVDTRRFTTGWCVFLGAFPIFWKCKKQARVSKSSTEAEYRLMSSVSLEIVWLQRLLAELGVPCS
eukprot:XP_015583359.1 uncharacterized protein LOC107262389 [Ricinus communis]